MDRIYRELVSVQSGHQPPGLITVVTSEKLKAPTDVFIGLFALITERCDRVK